MVAYIIYILLFLGIIYFRLRYKVTQELPNNFPKEGKIDLTLSQNRRVVMCVGDSLTHGNLGVNYIELLENQLPSNEFYCVNAGRNADLTYTLLNRLEAIIAHQPAFIILLIGTNDLQATMTETQRKRYISIDKISKETMPTFDTFQANYLKIVERLETETKAKIALVSLPVLGEDLAHEVNLKADEYSDFILATAKNKQLTYLPVREAMKSFLQQQPKQSKYSYDDAYLLLHLSVIRRYIFGQSWDVICSAHGNLLAQDMIHFNTKGSSFISDLVVDFVKKNEKK